MGPARQQQGPIAFVHIPKCSGTAFENYLKQAFYDLGHESGGFTGEAPDGGAERFTAFARRCQNSPFVFGHVPYALYREHFPICLPVTFLRDPVDRTISHYCSWHDPANFGPWDPHYRQAGTEVREALEFAQSATLEEFVRSELLHVKANALGNIQTLMLSTEPSDSTMEQHLESAKRNLEAMAFFGITERFDESIQHFRRIFHDAPPYGVANAHENRSKVDFDPPNERLREFIRDQCAFDAELLGFAGNLFDRRFNEATPAIWTLADVAGSGTPSSGGEASARLAALEAENGALRMNLETLTRQYEDLARVHRDITRSRGWRLLESVQAVIEKVWRR